MALRALRGRAVQPAVGPAPLLTELLLVGLEQGLRGLEQLIVDECQLVEVADPLLGLGLGAGLLAGDAPGQGVAAILLIFPTPKLRCTSGCSGTGPDGA